MLKVVDESFKPGEPKPEWNAAEAGQRLIDAVVGTHMPQTKRMLLVVDDGEQIGVFGVGTGDLPGTEAVGMLEYGKQYLMNGR